MFYLPIGTIQTAKVLRVIDTGYVLIKETDEVLLHNNEAKTKLVVDEEVEVFLYHDKNNELVATTVLPEIVMDAYGWAEVVEVIPKLGAFVDIGIAKDILVSVDDLPLFERVWPKTGDKLFVTLGKDQEERLIALPATEGTFEREREMAPEELFNQQFSGYVYFTSKEGSAVISEDMYRGFIHHTERKKEPRLGECITGRVIEVKEDGTVNLSLKPLKQDRIDEDAAVILAYLEENEGVMSITDRSTPNEIRSTFDFSKSAFKRAVGRLMRNRQVNQADGKTFLVKQD